MNICCTCDKPSYPLNDNICETGRDKYCQDCVKMCSICDSHCCFECNKDDIGYSGKEMDIVYHIFNCKNEQDCDCQYMFCLKCFKLCPKCECKIILTEHSRCSECIEPCYCGFPHTDPNGLITRSSLMNDFAKIEMFKRPSWADYSSLHGFSP